MFTASKTVDFGLGRFNRTAQKPEKQRDDSPLPTLQALVQKGLPDELAGVIFPGSPDNPYNQKDYFMVSPRFREGTVISQMVHRGKTPQEVWDKYTQGPAPKNG